MYLSISDEERKRAIQHIVENVPRETLLQIYEEISRDPDWLILHHFGIGYRDSEPSPKRGFCLG